MKHIGLIAALMVFAFDASAQTTALRTGKAVKVTPAATAEQSNQVRTLRVNDDVRQREVIRTTDGGEAQLLFEDGTRIAIGPDSTLILEEYVFAGRGRAEKVSVNALSGSFRFISGRSKKGTYSINTPVATIGVRGTAFDFTVSPDLGTAVVMFRGQVDLCPRDDPAGCLLVRGACRAAIAPPQRAPELVESEELRQGMIDDRFRYIQSQETLLVRFRLNIASCQDPSSLRELRRAAIDSDDQDGKRGSPDINVEFSTEGRDFGGFEPPENPDDEQEQDDENDEEEDGEQDQGEFPL